MEKTTFKILKMDCPAEEQLIKLNLEEFNKIHSLNFDLNNRKLEITHSEDKNKILEKLNSLNLNTSLLSSDFVDNFVKSENETKERKTLWIVLIINFLFFFSELIFGFISNSMGLIADSLDMLADAIVYGLALFAVGGTIARKKNIANFAGYFQIMLALIGFFEVIRRFVGLEKIPDYQTMIIVSIFALIANIVSFYLLHKMKSNEAHMQASMIFTSNDIIINSGVITAGLLVNWLNSSYPDLIIGAVVFLIVAKGAYRILLLSK